MKNRTHTVILLLAIVGFASCEKALMVPDVPATPAATFDYLWQRFDQQYSLFDAKRVDWDAVYDSLRPKVSSDISADSLFSVCAAMLNTLRDGHVNLFAGFDVSRSDSLYYNFYTRSGIDVNTVVLNYLGLGYHIAGGLAHNGLCNGRVIYIFYSSFSNSASIPLLRKIIATYPDAEGMIFDIRGNGGGSLSNVSNILSVMPSHGQNLYYSQIKTGPGHDDFSSPVATEAPIVSPDEAFTLPVVVLIDQGCFSAASLFSLCTMAYDNMTLMGDTTSGGLGLPSMGILPNGWRYRLPVTRTLALDGNNYENGVPPDIYLPFNRENAIRMGKDNIIDSASSLIINNHLN